MELPGRWFPRRELAAEKFVLGVCRFAAGGEPEHVGRRDVEEQPAGQVVNRRAGSMSGRVRREMKTVAAGLELVACVCGDRHL